MFQDLAGRVFSYAAGTAATVTVPAGAMVIEIIVHASAGSATVSIFGGTAIPIINGAPPTVIRFNHDLVQAATNNANNTIVFTNTDSYYVEMANSTQTISSTV
jgi:hypothetical protein